MTHYTRLVKAGPSRPDIRALDAFLSDVRHRFGRCQANALSPVDQPGLLPFHVRAVRAGMYAAVVVDPL